MKGLKSDTENSIHTAVGKTLICVVVLLTLASCGKSEFKIKFEFPKDFQGNYLLTYYAWDSRQGFWVETTAPVQEGRAEADALTSRPTLVYIFDASSPTNSIVVYAEKGDEITISGSNPDMLTWSVKGNKLSERWSAWRNANAEALREGRLGADKSEGKREKAIAAYVKDNPGDFLSTLMLLTEYDRRSDPQGFLRLWNSLDGKIRSSKATEIAGCPDLIGVEFQIDSKGRLAPAKGKWPAALVVRSKGNGTDTLRFAKSGPALLYFYTNTSDNRRANVDSIKVLAKEYPDSAKRIIADISFETDSMAWTGNIRGDSVRNAVRAWVPRGVADPDMVRMGVTRWPWLIVTDKSGKPVYEGPDIAEALRTFRKEMKKGEKGKQN